MSDPPSLRELLSPMVEREVELDGPGFPVDRARVLARMAEAGKPKRARWVGYAALAAAAVALLAVGVRFWPHERVLQALTVTVTDGSTTRVAPPSPTGELETTAGTRASVVAPDGLRLELSGQTHVNVAQLANGAGQVRLVDGAVRCTVPHRDAKRAFQVVTANVVVVDLGTVFTVSFETASHVTRVSVEEGQVLVRDASGERTVHAPNSWSNTLAPADSAPVSSVPVPPAASEAPPAPSASGARLPLKVAPAATLAQEAQLLRQGLAAERQGNSSQAIAAFSQLLQKYPHSPLAPDARAARARVEARSPQ